MPSLKQKTISGLFWTFSETLGNQLSSFIVGIFLARILSPTDYGLVGLIMVFVIISQVFVDSGLGQALIQKMDANDEDFSTVFIFNIVTSSVLYLVIYSFADFVSDFYKQVVLKDILRVVALVLIIDSLALVQRTKLTKDLNFKSLTKISLASSLISGVVGISLAFTGFGVWSLIYKTLIQHSLMALLYWYSTKWYPKFIFDINSFKSLLGFSYKLLLSSVIERLYQNFYVFIIGKFFSPEILGFYSRADQFKNLASTQLTRTLQRVTFPVLSKLQDDNISLMKAYRKVIVNSIFVTSFTMAALFSISESLIIVLIGEKWRQSIPLLQLLSIAGALYPIHAINLNLLTVKGRSDLFLRLEIIKKVIGFPVIIGMSFFGIKYMIIAGIGTSFIAFWINTYYTGQLIDYSGFRQMLDIFPSLLLGAVSALLTYLISLTLPDIMWLQLIILTLVMTTLYILGSIIFKFEEFYEIKNILIGFLPKKSVTVP